MITLIIIFVFRLKRGLNQTNGKAKGPILRKAITNAEVLKYHFSLGLVISIERSIYTLFFSRLVNAIANASTYSRANYSTTTSNYCQEHQHHPSNY